MLPTTRRFAALVLAAVLCAAGPVLAQDDPTAPLDGHTIRYIVAASAGGGTDRLGRILGRALQRALPRAAVRTQNVNGASGGVGLAEVQTASGGLVTLGFIGNGPIYAQLAGEHRGKYDLRTIPVIGSIVDAQRLIVMRAGLGEADIDTIRQLGRQPVTAGPGVRGSGSYTEAVLANAMLGLRMKVVTDVARQLAETLVLAGDLDVLLGSYGSLRTTIDSGEVVPVVMYDPASAPAGLEGVPGLAEVVTSAQFADLVPFMRDMSRGGRKLVAAPATSAEHLAALRAAFVVAIEDPQYLADLEEAGIEPGAVPGEEVEAQLRALLTDGNALREKLLSAIACGEALSAGETCG